MRKKRIALVYKDLSLGGIQKKIVDISNELISHKDVEAYIFLTKKKGEFLEKIPPAVHVVDLHSTSKLPFVFLLPLKLWLNFIRHKPHVIFAMMDTYGCASVLAGKMMGEEKPRIIISQDILPSRFFEQRPFRKFRKWLVNKLYPESDCIVSLSQAINRDLVENFKIPKKKIVLMRNWIRKPAYEKYKGKEKKDMDILYAGRFAPEKNLSLLIDAFGLLLKKRPSATLCLLGYGGEEKVIKEKIEQLGMEKHVLVPGFTHDVSKFLTSSKVFALPSSNEGTPMAMLEAMAMRVPVISTNFPGAGEIIQQGESGIIADSAKEMSLWMNRLLSDDTLRTRIIKGAFTVIKERYPPYNLMRLVKLIYQYA